MNEFEKLVLENIDLSEYDYVPTPVKHIDNYLKVQYVYGIFLEEQVPQLVNKTRSTQVKSFEKWLRGLPTCFTLPIYYTEFTQWAKEVGLSLETEMDYLATFYTKCAEAFFTLKDNL